MKKLIALLFLASALAVNAAPTFLKLNVPANTTCCVEATSDGAHWRHVRTVQGPKEIKLRVPNIGHKVYRLIPVKN